MPATGICPFFPRCSSAWPSVSLRPIWSFPWGRSLTTSSSTRGRFPKCVASSTCIGKSGQEWFDLKKWQAYNDQELYTACGGTGSTGIYTDKCLKYAQDTGVLLADGSKRFRIASFMFAPKERRVFRETLAAALMETGPCVVAMILPTNFGWNSGADLQGAQSYHQMCLWGWEGLEDNDWAVFLNSWGVQLWQPGLCSGPLELD